MGGGGFGGWVVLVLGSDASAGQGELKKPLQQTVVHLDAATSAVCWKLGVGLGNTVELNANAVLARRTVQFDKMYQQFWPLRLVWRPASGAPHK